MTPLERFNEAVRAYNKATGDLQTLNRVIEVRKGKVDLQTVMPLMHGALYELTDAVGALIEVARPLATEKNTTNQEES